MTELEEVISKSLLLDIHDFVSWLNGAEGLDGLSELGLNGHDGGAHGLTLRVTNLDLLQLVELLDRLRQLHDVLAPLDEGIKSDEEGAGCDLPGGLALGLVVVVGLLELGTEFHAHSELAVGFCWVLLLDGFEDALRADLTAALLDDGVANLADEHKQAGRRVVVLGVGPDQQNGVHDGDKALGDFGKLVTFVHQVVDVLLEGLEILRVLIGLQSCDVDLFLKLAESAGLSGLVLLQELEHLLDALARELLADGV